MYKKVGGLHFVRVGRFGASFFASRKEPHGYEHGSKLVAIVFGAYVAMAVTVAVASYPKPDAFASCINELAEGNPAVTGCRG